MQRAPAFSPCEKKNPWDIQGFFFVTAFHLADSVDLRGFTVFDLGEAGTQRGDLLLEVGE